MDSAIKLDRDAVTDRLAKLLYDIQEHLDPTMRPNYSDLDCQVKDYYTTTIESLLIEKELVAAWYACD